MRFERINDSNVRCIIDEDDMRLFHVEMDDFFTNSEKLHDFLHKMVHEAKKEVGYKPRKGVLSMQIMPLSENSLAINLSESERLEEEQERVVEVEPTYLRIYEFQSLENAIYFCSTISNRCQLSSALYKNDGKYYLCIERGNASVANFARVCMRAYEFGKLISDSPSRKAFIEEQYECIFEKKAIIKLNKV